MLFSVLLLSCSKDDDSENEVNNPLIGTWYLIEVEGEPSLSDCQKESFHTFTADKLIEKYFSGIKEDGGCKLDVDLEYSYSPAGNKIKVSGGNEVREVPFEIKDGVLTLSLHEPDGSFFFEKYFKK